MSRDDWLFVAGLFWLINLATWVVLRMWNNGNKQK